MSTLEARHLATTPTSASPAGSQRRSVKPHTIVIGAGISGLLAALEAHRAGHRVTIVTKGFGGLQLSAGTIDIYDDDAPLEAAARIGKENPDHPYAHISTDDITAGIEALRAYIPLEGSAEHATKLPTALGAIRRTSLFPHSYAAGALDSATDYLIVGFSGIKDFYPKLVAENLANQGISARAEVVTLIAKGDTSLQYSRLLESDEALQRLAEALKRVAQPGEHIGIPAVLREDAARKLEHLVGQPVFQIPTPPPLVPGLGFNEILRAATQQARIQLMLNAAAVGAVPVDGRLTKLKVQVAGAVKDISADYVIYAAGGLDSGAIEIDSYFNAHDTVFDFPVTVPTGHVADPDYWGKPQGAFAAGLATDDDLHPVGEDGTPVYTNVYAVGGMLSGAWRAREKDGEGIALGSVIRALNAIKNDAMTNERIA